MISSLLVNLIATACLTGLIWFVQIVHYPLMAAVGEREFIAYETAHTRLTTFVVAPLMLVEAATSIMLVWRPPPGVDVWLPWVGVVFVVMLWLSTALVQVPSHARLARGFDRATHRRLVVTNWIRTTLWSARTLLMGYAVLRGLA